MLLTWISVVVVTELDGVNWRAALPGVNQWVSILINLVRKFTGSEDR